MNTAPDWLAITTGVLVLIVGFLFHWVGQLVSVLNWDLATRLGLQEKNLLPEHIEYEHGTAVADVLVGWVYGLAGVGLLMGAPWGLKLAWIPGTVFVYHALSAWFWERNHRRSGHGHFSNALRVVWCGGNFIAGLLALYVGWISC